LDNYNKFAAEYDAFTRDTRNNDTEVELGRKLIARLLGECLQGKILDYGCGPGNCSRFLKSCGAEVVGVDIAQKEIEIAKSYHDGIDYHAIESGRLEKLPSDFDAVVFSFVLLTISTMAEIVKILTACRGKIKPNGKLVILNGNIEASHGREFISFSIQALTNPKSGDPVRVKLGRDRSLEVTDFYWTQADYEAMLNQSGFVLDEVLEPIATEGTEWRDEREYSPCKLMSARPN